MLNLNMEILEGLKTVTLESTSPQFIAHNLNDFGTVESSKKFSMR